MRKFCQDALKMGNIWLLQSKLVCLIYSMRWNLHGLFPNVFWEFVALLWILSTHLRRQTSSKQKVPDPMWAYCYFWRMETRCLFSTTMMIGWVDACLCYSNVRKNWSNPPKYEAIFIVFHWQSVWLMTFLLKRKKEWMKKERKKQCVIFLS